MVSLDIDGAVICNCLILLLKDNLAITQAGLKFAILLPPRLLMLGVQICTPILVLCASF